MNKDYFLKRLAFSQPTAQTSYNYDLLPETFKATDKIPIDCLQHGVFYQKAAVHLIGSGCSACGLIKSSNGRALTTEIFIRLSKLRFGERFSYHKTEYVRKEMQLTVTCPTHGDLALTADQHLSAKFGCLECGIQVPRALKAKRVLEKALVVHGGQYDYSKVVFTNMSKKVEIVCPHHGSFWQDLYGHTVRKNKCPKCAIVNDRLSYEDFVAKSMAIHGRRYDYSKVIYKTNTSLVTIVCEKHGEFIQRASSHLAGCMCKKCFLEEALLSTEKFIENAKKIHGNSYDYSKVSYRGNKRPVEIVCPHHGSFWQKPNTHVSSRQGCRFCQESKGERAVEIVLRKYGIGYIREYRVMPHLFRYDFFLPDFNIFIEFNGLQHYQPVDIFGGIDAFLRTRERDQIKKTLVKQHGGRLVTLTYLNLSNDSVEKALIYGLKRIFRHWFSINGKIEVFNDAIDVCRTFGIPMSVELKNLNTQVEKMVSGLSVLF